MAEGRQEGQHGLVSSGLHLLSPTWCPCTRFHPQEEGPLPSSEAQADCPGPLSDQVMEVSLPASGPLQPKTQQQQNPLPFRKARALPLQYSLCGFLPCSRLIFPARKNSCARGGHLLSMWGGAGAGRAGDQLYGFFVGTNGVGPESPRVLILGGEGRLYWAIVLPPGIWLRHLWKLSPASEEWCLRSFCCSSLLF